MNTRPWAADRRFRTAVAWVRCLRWLRIDHAAASYGEWNSTGRSPGSSVWSRPITGIAATDLGPRRPGLIQREHAAHLVDDLIGVGLTEDPAMDHALLHPG